MGVSLSNGCIINTCASLVLFLASYMNLTVSCTYILIPCLMLIRKREKGHFVNKYKVMKGLFFAFIIMVLSAAASVISSFLLLDLDYKGQRA